MSTTIDLTTGFPPVEAHFLSSVPDLPKGYVCVRANDSGCTRILSLERSDFVTFQPCKTKIVVAKKGVDLEAEGVGDILLHTRDQVGYPVSILLTNCLWVPGAHCRLVSAVALATDGYQTVLPSDGRRILILHLACISLVMPPGFSGTTRS